MKSEFAASDCQAAFAPDAGQGQQQALVHGAHDAVRVGRGSGRPEKHVEAGEED